MSSGSLVLCRNHFTTTAIQYVFRISSPSPSARKRPAYPHSSISRPRNETLERLRSPVLRPGKGSIEVVLLRWPLFTLVGPLVNAQSTRLKLKESTYYTRHDWQDDMVLPERLQQASTRTNERWKIIVTWAPDGSKEGSLLHGNGGGWIKVTRPLRGNNPKETGEKASCLPFLAHCMVPVCGGATYGPIVW